MKNSLQSNIRAGGNIYKHNYHDLCHDLHHEPFEQPCDPDPCDPCGTSGYGGIIAVVIIVIIIIVIILFIIFRQKTKIIKPVECKTNTPLNVTITSPSNKTVKVEWVAVTPNIPGNPIEYTVFLSSIKNFGSTDVGVQIIKTPNTTVTFGGVLFTPAFVKVQALEKDCEPSDLSEEKSVVIECTVVIPNSGINFQVTKIGMDITEAEFDHVEGAKSYQLEIWRSDAVGPAINERHTFFREDNAPVPDGTIAGVTLAFDFTPTLSTAGGEEYYIVIHAINECGKSKKSDNVYAL